MSIDILRGAFASLLFFIGLHLWNDWQAAHPAVPTVVKTNNVTESTTTNSSPIAIQGVVAPPHSLEDRVITTVNNSLITIQTDVLKIKIDPVGAAMVHAALLQYPNSLKDNKPFVLFNQRSDNFYTAQSGLISPQGPDNATAALYKSTQMDYILPANQQKLVVPMTWYNAEGLKITKTFTFTRGSYLVNVAFTINNNTAKAWNGQLYTQLKRTPPPTKANNLFQVTPFMGAVISTPEKRYEKFTYHDLDKNPINQTITNGWMAMEQHYFLSAWIPNSTESFQYSTQKFENSNLYAINMIGPVISVAPNQKKTVQANLYVGPSIANNLKKVAPGLDLTVDYGFLWPIGVVLFWLLDHIHHYVGNWGWAIVLLTLLIKLCFFKLSAASYKSMAAMRKLQPQLQQIKEKYGDDRQKVGQMTMELYKKEKVNPMGGCLPLLVQIPVFFALYWVLFASVQLRLAPFILWIHDLSSADPYFILPILMGATMFLQQKMSPPPPDPTQAKLMMAMPLIMTFFFLNFPSGLVLYWVVSNFISIIQQWVITRRYNKKK